MIKTIPKHVKAQFPEIIKQAIKDNLSCEPADRPTAERALRNIYRNIGYKHEIKIIWVESPIVGAVLASVISTFSDKDFKSDKTILKQKAISAVKNKQIKWELWRAGQFWISWNVFIDTLLKFIPYNKIYDSNIEEYKLAKSAGYYWAFEKLAIICERPKLIKLDDQNRLHNPDGPSISYGPLFELYSWHGVTIPKEWILDKTFLTAEIALKTVNIEQRRAACEILGWNKIVKGLKGKVIDKHPNPQVGELIEVHIPDIGKEKFLRVLCGTGREFALPVPPEMKTALQAQAWTWGLNEETFSIPEIRT